MKTFTRIFDCFLIIMLVMSCSTSDVEPIVLEEKLEPTRELYFHSWEEVPNGSLDGIEWLWIRATWDRSLSIAYGTHGDVMNNPRWTTEERGCILKLTDYKTRPVYVRLIAEGVDSTQIVY